MGLHKRNCRNILDKKEIKEVKIMSSCNDKTNRYDYFEFNGVLYAAGTKIEMTDSRKRELYGSFYDENYQSLATFEYRNKGGERIYCTYDEICRGKKVNRSSPTYTVFCPDEKNIKCIVKPVYYQKTSDSVSALTNFISGEKHPDIFNQLLWYIFIVCFLFICKGGIVGIVFATFVLVRYLIDQYKD